MRVPLAKHLVGAVTAVWAGEVPTITLQALWSRGDVAPVYAIARALAPARRPGMLAWLAALDPEPDSPRVVQAAKEALRMAAVAGGALPVLALVPLADPGVLQLARRLAHAEGRQALDLRTSGAPHEPRDTSGAVLHALHAVWLADRGRRDEADAALAAALRDHPPDTASERALIPAIRRLDAWALAPGFGLDGTTAHWISFVAGTVGEAAVDRLSPAARSFVSAVLGAGHLPDAWREQLPGSTEELLAELWSEGLISREEQWAMRLGPALGDPKPHERVTAIVHASLAAAHAPAAHFAEDLAARWTGAPRDEARIAERDQRLRKLLDAPSDEDRLTWRTLRRVLLPCRKLGELGGAAEVRHAVAALEQRWGPAEGWTRSDSWLSSTTLETTAELLARAEGRSLDALRLDTAESQLSVAVRVQIAAGLARDGHPGALGPLLERLLDASLEPDEVAALATAALALDPAARDSFRDTLEQGLASLPATPDAARTWLDATDLASLRRTRRRGASPPV